MWKVASRIRSASRNNRGIGFEETATLIVKERDMATARGDPVDRAPIWLVGKAPRGTGGPN
jgi:hypothetical protein